MNRRRRSRFIRRDLFENCCSRSFLGRIQMAGLSNGRIK
jgi:hypothetical protein